MVFKNKYFYLALVVLISALLLYNAWNLIQSKDLTILLPVFIQVILLILIFSKSKLVKIALQIWSIIFFLIAGLMQVVGKFLIDLSQGFVQFDIRNYFLAFSLVIIGFFILSFTNSYIVSANDTLVD